MAFKIICPHCQKLITDKDFLESEQSIAHLQQFFTSQEDKYKQDLQATWQEQQKFIITAQLKTQENNLNKEKQKQIDELNQQINSLITQNKNFEAMLQTQLTQKELAVIKTKQLEIDHIKNQNQEQQKLLMQKINDLTLKLEQGRNIKSGILGSNLENDFERIMNTFYLSDNFEKTTKVKNGRKPDFMLTILNPRDEKKAMGKILFELKNKEKLALNDVEEKLAKELKEWNADFGLIIWSAAHAPFVHSKNYSNIFIVNTDFEILVLIVNVLKLLINKQYNLEHAIEIKALDEKMMEKFKIWIKEDFNNIIGKAMDQFTKFESNIDKLKKTTDDLTKIKDQLKQIIIDKIEIKLKSF